MKHIIAPFEWEGDKRTNLALNMLDKFEEADCDTFIFRNDRITEVRVIWLLRKVLYER